MNEQGGQTATGRSRANEMQTTTIDAVNGPRVARETQVNKVEQAVSVPVDQVRWGPIWAGLVTALTSLLLLSLLGLAVGLTTVNAGGAAASGAVPGDTSRNTAIWEAVVGIVSFLVGGYVAGRSAAVHDRGAGAFNGAMVFLVGIPLTLLFASQGLGVLLGSIGTFASTNMGQVQHAITGIGGSAAHATPAQVASAAMAARNGAWGTLIGAVLGLLAATIGGLMGTRTGRPNDVSGSTAG